MNCKADSFIDSVKGKIAFNVPAKQVWKNQWGTGYVFDDGSYLKVLNKATEWTWCSLEAYASLGGLGIRACSLLNAHCLRTYQSHKFSNIMGEVEA